MNREKVLAMGIDYVPKFFIWGVVTIFLLGGLWAMFRSIPQDVSRMKDSLISFDKRITILETYVDDRKREERFRRLRSQ